MTTRGPVDVLTVGGGPAGTTVVEALARAGFSATLIERSQYESGLRPGEVVPPVAKPLFSSLGTWNRISAEKHTILPGTLISWGHDAPLENDFLFSPYGHGWCLDRSLFDRGSADAAEAAGARVMRGAVLERLARTTAGWSAEVKTKLGVAQIEARFLVDATGRRASVARSLGIEQLYYDRMVALIGIFEPTSDSWRKRDSRLMLEAAQDGWWYAAPLPAGRSIVAYFTDADLLKRQVRSQPTRNALAAVWDGLIVGTSLARHRVAAMRRRQLSVVDCSTRLLTRTAGDTWLAVGDAGLSFDPLSSQGLLGAVGSAVSASACLTRTAQGDGQAMTEYREQAAQRFEALLQAHRFHYARERRWHGAEFWRRRQDGRFLRLRKAGRGRGGKLAS